MILFFGVQKRSLANCPQTFPKPGAISPASSDSKGGGAKSPPSVKTLRSMTAQSMTVVARNNGPGRWAARSLPLGLHPPSVPPWGRWPGPPSAATAAPPCGLRCSPACCCSRRTPPGCGASWPGFCSGRLQGEGRVDPLGRWRPRPGPKTYWGWPCHEPAPTAGQRFSRSLVAAQQQQQLARLGAERRAAAEPGGPGPCKCAVGPAPPVVYPVLHYLNIKAENLFRAIFSRAASCGHLQPSSC